jgi:hypothetical protein
MKLIITEEQYRKLTKNETCPTAVKFEVYNPIRVHWKKRTRCVSQEFFNLINDYHEIQMKTGEENPSEKLIKLIEEYYYNTYYYTPDEYTISSITPWRVLIKLEHKSS